ncbi:MAG: hypothetical protein ACKVT0_13880 [Planctomycetaceae bacterium]
MNPKFDNSQDHAILDDINVNTRAESETVCCTSDTFMTDNAMNDRGLVYTKDQIASLTQEVISEMTCADLIDAIKSTELPLLTDDKIARLMFQDRDTLERLLYLARKCVRNQGY